MLATGLEAHPFVERGACEGGGLLTTRNSQLLAKRKAKETGQEAFPVPGLPLPSTFSGGGGSSITTGYCLLQLPSVGPNKSHI